MERAGINIKDNDGVSEAIILLNNSTPNFSFINSYRDLIRM